MTKDRWKYDLGATHIVARMGLRINIDGDHQWKPGFGEAALRLAFANMWGAA